MIHRKLAKPLASIAKRATNNRRGQALLGNLVTAAQYLQGIGAGTDVQSSGEAAVFEKLKASADRRRPLCVFDVGANQGQFLNLACRRLAGRAFAIHSFEPARQTYEMLERNARGIENATLNRIGFGREPGELELFYDVPGSGTASLTKRSLDHFGVHMNLSEKVEIQTIDGYCAKRAISRIDLLKIDVEGHELDVLSGARRMFGESAIGMAAFEFGGCNIDTRTFFQDFFQFFAERRMRIARIAPGGYLWEIASYREALEQFRASNFVCYPA